MDRGEAVPEFVRETGGQLPEPRKAVLESQLLFQLHDRAEISEKTDDAAQAAVLVANPRNGDAQMRRSSPRLQRQRAPDDWLAARQALLDDLRKRRSGQHLAVVALPVGVREAQQPPGCRIEDPDVSGRVPTTMRPEVMLAMISLLSRSEASALAVIARSCT